MIGHIAKALTALVVVSIALFVGDQEAKGFNVEVFEGAIIAIATAVGVYFMPNTGTPPRR